MDRRTPIGLHWYWKRTGELDPSRQESSSAVSGRSWVGALQGRPALRAAVALPAGRCVALVSHCEAVTQTVSHYRPQTGSQESYEQ